MAPRSLHAWAHMGVPIPSWGLGRYERREPMAPRSLHAWAHMGVPTLVGLRELREAGAHGPGPWAHGGPSPRGDGHGHGGHGGRPTPHERGSPGDPGSPPPPRLDPHLSIHSAIIHSASRHNYPRMHVAQTYFTFHSCCNIAHLYILQC